MSLVDFGAVVSPRLEIGKQQIYWTMKKIMANIWCILNTLTCQLLFNLHRKCIANRIYYSSPRVINDANAWSLAVFRFISFIYRFFFFKYVFVKSKLNNFINCIECGNMSNKKIERAHKL